MMSGFIGIDIHEVMLVPKNKGLRFGLSYMLWVFRTASRRVLRRICRFSLFSMLLSKVPFLPVGDYVGTETIWYDVEVHVFSIYQEAYFFKGGRSLVGVVAYLRVFLFLSLVLLVVFKLRLIFDPFRSLSLSLPSNSFMEISRFLWLSICLS